MKALFVVGTVFLVMTLWAINLTTNHNATLATEPSIGRRSLQDKTAMALAFVQKQLDERGVPGLSMSVVYKNETVIARGFGTKEHGNPTNAVTPRSLFQIGSYSKTFVALCIAKLIDQGRMTWHDPVKQHLPVFQLQDKYAEQFTTLADLLSMNSVLGEEQEDHASEPLLFLGMQPTELDYVKSLALINTTRPFRAGYAYSNWNFEILGQVVAHVTNRTWFHFLKESFLDPLGMTDTVGRPGDAANASEVSFGHLICGDSVRGPFSFARDLDVAITPTNDLVAAGSILSSARDMATFSRFLLQRGHGVLTSPSLIDDMTTGQGVIPASFPTAAFGLRVQPDGNVIGTGYGIDLVGNLLFGYDFYMKNGGTAAFEMANGFVPSQELAVTLNVNALVVDTTFNQGYLEPLRSYVMGIFLDVPEKDLDDMWATSQAFYRNEPKCDPYYFGTKKRLPVPADMAANVIGTYEFAESPAFYGRIRVFKQGAAVVMQWGVMTRPLVAMEGKPNVLVWTVDRVPSVVLVVTAGPNSTTQLQVAGLASLSRVGP